MHTGTRLAGLFLVLALLLPGASVWAGKKPDHHKGKPQQSEQQTKKSGKSPREAAARAQAEHGGKVLKVSPDKGGYKVRLLQDSGRVITVKVKD
jgi:uncharacterized membrane protein YkoI